MTTQPQVPLNSQSPPDSGTTVQIIRRSAAVAAAGLVGAVFAWLVIGGIGEVFQLPPELAKLGLGGIPGPEDQERITAGNLVLQYKHSALWLGAAGAILGGLFGLTLGFFRTSRASVLRGAVAGMLSGGFFGGIAGALAVYADRLLQTNLPAGTLTVPEHMLILMHAATWLVIGLGIGLGTGLGAFGNRRRTVTTSMLLAGVAGLLGGVLYPFVAGLALPLADPSQPIPEGVGNQLLWLGLPSVLIGLALGRKG